MNSKMNIIFISFLIKDWVAIELLFLGTYIYSSVLALSWLNLPLTVEFFTFFTFFHSVHQSDQRLRAGVGDQPTRELKMVLTTNHTHPVCPPLFCAACLETFYNCLRLTLTRNNSHLAPFNQLKYLHHTAFRFIHIILREGKICFTLFI